jgi:hypothetical protein
MAVVFGGDHAGDPGVLTLVHCNVANNSLKLGQAAG